MFHQRFRLSLFSVLAACMIALAGCGGGGGGGGGARAPEPDPRPTPEQIAAEMAALQTAKDAASAAAMAAYTALGSAKAAVDGAGADQDHDPVHFALATTELGKAKDAYQAAQAASDAAQMAGTSADAQMYQAQAEAAQAMAEAALAEATNFADAVTAMGDAARAAAQAAADADAAAAAEAMALSDAQSAAMTAYEMASAASTAAAGAVSAVADQSGDDMASYMAAQAAAQAAADAATAAAAANMAAAAATSSADAQMYQAQAEAAQGNAETAQSNAMMYAGMVTTAYNAAEAMRQANDAEAMALADAKAAAMSAAQMARAAATAAMMAVTDVAANSEADQGSYASAQAQAAAAEAAAQGAEAANVSAQGATASSVAEAAQGLAEAALARAVAAQENAEMYAGMVTTAHNTAEENRLAMEQEARDLAEAKSDASDAAGAARMAANAAAMEAQAGVDLGDPVTAQQVADAEAAAVAAEAASASAQAAMTSGEAQGYRDTAQGKQTEAENAKTAAVNASMEAVRHAGIADPTEAIAIIAARSAASEAARDARTAANAAATAATAAGGDNMVANDAAAAAEAAAEEAEAAAEAAAMADNLVDAEMYRDTAQTKEGEAQGHQATAQTASTNAIADARFLENTRADALAGPISSAETAASSAQTAADNAKRDADAEYDKAKAARTHADDTDEDDEGSVADAVAAAQAAVTAANNAANRVAVAKSTIMNADSTQTIAAEVEKARAAMRDAATAMTDAASALEAAMAAAGEHVLALFRAANALDVPDANMMTEENEAAEIRLDAIVMQVNTAAEVEATTSDTNINSGGTDPSDVTVMYPLDTKDDPDTEDMDESAAAKRAFTFTGAGETIAAIDFTVADDAAEGTMPEATKTYLRSLGSMGDFAGVELTKGDGIAHVYTNIMQTDEGATTEKEVTTTDSTRIDVNIVSDSTATGFNFDDIMGLAPVADKSETTDMDESMVNGAQAFMGTLTYDHDNDAANDDVTYEGQFTCKDTGVCVVERGAGSAVISLTNYEFVPNDTQTETQEVKADDTVDTDFLTFGVWLDNDATSSEIGVFARGNNDNSNLFTVDNIQALGGTASYSGPAVGVYTDGSSVEHFDGTANLMANFGLAGGADADDPDTTGDDTTGEFGYIEGIVTINGGGNTPAGTVNLGRTDMDDGPFAGSAWKGAANPVDPETGVSTGYAYQGTWGGQFFGNPAADAEGDAMQPGSVAGTFGVTGMDDDVTRSWIGAFGAEKQ